jgi:hypothetical protein
MSYRGHTPISGIEIVGPSAGEADGGIECFRRVTITEWLHEDLLRRAGLTGETELGVSGTLRERTTKSTNRHRPYSYRSEPVSRLG